MPNFSIERKFSEPVIGIDEVGRGPLAGPVISCAFIFFDKNLQNKDLNFINDSKKLSAKKRILALQGIYNLKKKKKFNIV